MKPAVPLILLSMLLAGCTPDDIEKNPGSEFPYESKYVEVLGSKMHYIDQGEGTPILFLHGNPTSVYLWRNVLPHLEKNGRVIAVDLIGMGKSDKPDVDYRFITHYKYLNAFIQELGLKDIVLVIHDWGSGLGFHYWAQNPKNVKGIAFMEAITRPFTWDDFDFPFNYVFGRFRDPEAGPEWIVEDHFFVETMLPNASYRGLTEEEHNAYRQPYLEKSSRKPILAWPNEIPIDGEPADTYALISNYNAKLKESNIPKLLLYADPGGLIKGKADAEKIASEFPNTDTVFLGSGRHYVQEDHPEKIGTSISKWMAEKGL